MLHDRTYLDKAWRRSEYSRLSLASHWAFSDEDFVGRVAKMVSAAHPSSASLVVLQKWAIYVFTEYMYL